MPTFYEKFAAIHETHGPLCLGLDPSKQLLEKWSLPLSIHGLKEFTKIVFNATEDLIGIIKPQFAFYEQFGPEGLQILKDTIKKAHKRNMLVIADCKRGDISSSLIAYVHTILGPESFYQADAMTVLPYMGIDAFNEAFDYAHKQQSQIFVVAQSSNPEGVELQNAKTSKQSTVIETILQTIQNYNKAKDSIGPVGSVIGATIRSGDIPLNLNLLNNQLMLVPGMGAQGANWQNIKQKLPNLHHQVIPTCSRSILQAGPEPKQLQQAIIKIKKEISA